MDLPPVTKSQQQPVPAPEEPIHTGQSGEMICLRVVEDTLEYLVYNRQAVAANCPRHRRSLNPPAFDAHLLSWEGCGHHADEVQRRDQGQGHPSGHRTP